MKQVNRQLVIKAYHVTDISLEQETAYQNGKLSLNLKDQSLLTSNKDDFKSADISLIHPGCHDIEVNSIMDIIPISSKVLGKLGSGITHTFTGVYVMLTGAFEDGRQLGEFGSSEGILKEQLCLGRAGTPGPKDYIIHVDFLVKNNVPFNRTLTNKVFKSCDEYIQTLRQVLKNLDGRKATETHRYEDVVKANAKKIAIVKQIAGQGAMYDNLLFPNEPSGFIGGKSIIDLNNLPILLSPNEYRDGAIRALT